LNDAFLVLANDKELEVRQAMRELSRALTHRDAATVARLLDDDFTGFDASGVLVSKAQWLADLASGDLVFHAIDAGDVDFQVLDDAVRVHADLTFRARYSRSSYNGSFHCLGMFVKRDDAWKLLISKARVVPSM
jgi:ketosteroid isomerase-like protein